jgi:hypothetical protein
MIGILATDLIDLFWVEALDARHDERNLRQSV